MIESCQLLRSRLMLLRAVKGKATRTSCTIIASDYVIDGRLLSAGLQVASQSKAAPKSVSLQSRTHLLIRLD